MKKEEIILVGGGGHCLSCIDVIEQENKFSIAGIVDTKEKVGKKVLGYPIIAEDSELSLLAKQFRNFIISLGHIKSPDIRIQLFKKLINLDVKIPIIVSPKAYVSKYSKLGKGTVVFHGAVINANVSIGQNNIINTKAVIEHDSIIGNNCHISVGAILNGGVNIENNIFVGSGTVVREQVSIKENTIIGASSYVSFNITEDGTYVGSPVKRLK